MSRIILIILFFSFSFCAEAGHLVGGEISYEQISGDTYIVSLKMYRDCYASGLNVSTKFDSHVNLSIYDASNNSLIRVLQIERPADSTRLPLVVEVPCLPDPPDICILEMIYSDTLIIDIPQNGVYLVNQRCCRTSSVLNINSPTQFGSTYSAFIPGSNLFINNSSPTFSIVPPIALCAGIYLELDYSASDIDSDSLYYDFCTPYHGGGAGNSNTSPLPDTPSAPPFDTISWKNSFDKNYQISSSPSFEINHETGIISGRPDQIGTYAFGVCVSEYRDGLKLGENKRDFQMEVTPCDVEAAAAIDSAVEECIGLQIQFYNKSTLGKHFFWDFGDPNTTLDTSSKSNPTYTYPDTGIYTIKLIALGETGCSDTAFFTYNVRPKIIPEFTFVGKTCFDNNSFDFEQGGIAKSTTQKYWVIKGDTMNIVPDQIGIYNQRFADVGNHIIQLVYEDFGCVKIQEDTISIYQNPEASIVQPYQESCVPFLEQYSVDYLYAGSPSYTWYVNDSFYSASENPIIQLNQAGFYDLSIVMITDSLCIDTVESNYLDHILLLERPDADFGLNSTRLDMFEPLLQISDSSKKSDRIEFLINEELVSQSPFVELLLPDTGDYFVSQYAYNENGCLDSLSKKLRVVPEFLVFIPNSFSPNSDQLNELWLPKVFTSKAYHLRIRNRWGHIIFESTDPSLGWNGSKHNSGNESPQGFYYYHIEASDLGERSYEYTGTITLYR
jgi:gliding motility-associated-like protein